MTNKFLATVAAAALLSGILGFSVASFGMDRKEIETVVRETIMKDPKLVVDALEKFQSDQMAEQQQAADKAAMDNKAWIFDTKKHPAAGKEGGKRLAEFFDYNCGYCKKAYPEVAQLLDKDSAQVVFIEMPILGDSSLEAAKWALASAKQGKYFDYHKALMSHKGPKDPDVLETIAERVGLNVDQLKKDKDAPEIAKQIDENLNKAQSIGLTGTPAFVTEEAVLRGFTDYEGLKAALK